MIDTINHNYPVNQCSNQDFEMVEDEYPKITINQPSGIDIGGYGENVYLTNQYYATIARYGSNFDYYFSRMVYRIAVGDIKEEQCYTEVNITVTGLDYDNSIVFFSDSQRTGEYKKYNFKRRYYTCKYNIKYQYINYYCLIYRELKNVDFLSNENINDICSDVDSNPSEIITVKTTKIDLVYNGFLGGGTLTRNGIIIIVITVII